MHRLDLDTRDKFMAVWEALTQYVDNNEYELLCEEEEGIDTGLRTKQEAARGMMEHLDSIIAAQAEGLCVRKDCPVCGGPNA